MKYTVKVVVELVTLRNEFYDVEANDENDAEEIAIEKAEQSYRLSHFDSVEVDSVEIVNRPRDTVNHSQECENL